MEEQCKLGRVCVCFCFSLFHGFPPAGFLPLLLMAEQHQDTLSGCKGLHSSDHEGGSTSATTQPISLLSQPFPHVEPGKINAQILTAALRPGTDPSSPTVSTNPVQSPSQGTLLGRLLSPPPSIPQGTTTANRGSKVDTSVPGLSPLVKTHCPQPCHLWGWC